MQIKGFTVLELAFVLCTMAIVSLLTVPLTYRVCKMNSVEREIDNIVLEQIEAISQSAYHSYENEEDDVTVKFNRMGNVMHAETVHVTDSDVIIALGTGRVYVRKP